MPRETDQDLRQGTHNMSDIDVPYEVNKELVLSVAHISVHDGGLLRRGLGLLTVLPYAYGWRILLFNWDLDAEREQHHRELRSAGYSASLVGLMELARSLECKWLVLDQDASKHEELKQFEW